MLLGGPPFPEQLVMWWNFVGRSHDDIVLYRQMWQDHDGRFGAVEGYKDRRHACPPRRCQMRRCVRGPIPGYRGRMTTDKTGAPTTVTQESDRFSISVDGQKVGFAEFADRDGQRIFTHTEVLDEFGGRGLATILIDEALQETPRRRAADRRRCARWWSAIVKKHHEFDDVVDPVNSDVKRWLANS